jgi:hypothetical protein
MIVVVTPAQTRVQVWIPAPSASSGQAQGKLFAGMTGTGRLSTKPAKVFNFRIPVQAFTLRWWVLGMRMSSRYFATVRRVTQ